MGGGSLDKVEAVDLANSVSSYRFFVFLFLAVGG